MLACINAKVPGCPTGQVCRHEVRPAGAGLQVLLERIHPCPTHLCPRTHVAQNTKVPCSGKKPHIPAKSQVHWAAALTRQLALIYPHPRTRPPNCTATTESKLDCFSAYTQLTHSQSSKPATQHPHQDSPRLCQCTGAGLPPAQLLPEVLEQHITYSAWRTGQRKNGDQGQDPDPRFTLAGSG